MKCSITTVASWSKCIPHLSPRQRQAGHEYFCNGHCMICKEESVPKARARGDHQVAAAGCGMALQPLKAYGRQIARPGERGLIPGGDLPMLVQGWTPKARGMRRPAYQRLDCEAARECGHSRKRNGSFSRQLLLSPTTFCRRLAAGLSRIRSDPKSLFHSPNSLRRNNAAGRACVLLRLGQRRGCGSATQAARGAMRVLAIIPAQAAGSALALAS